MEKLDQSFRLNMPKMGSMLFHFLLADPLCSLFLILELTLPNHLKSLNTLDTALSHSPPIMKVLSFPPHLSIHAFLIIPTPQSCLNLSLDCFKNYNFKHLNSFKLEGNWVITQKPHYSHTITVVPHYPWFPFTWFHLPTVNCGLKILNWNIQKKTMYTF